MRELQRCQQHYNIKQKREKKKEKKKKKKKNKKSYLPICKSQNLFCQCHEQLMILCFFARHNVTQAAMHVGHRSVVDFANINLLRMLMTHKVAHIVRSHTAVRD